MTATDRTPSTTRLARLAGLLYVAIIALGIGGDALVRGPIHVPGDASQTVANLAAAELPFRLSILGDVLMALSDVGLAALLFILLRPLSPRLALAAMVFRLVQAAILGLNLSSLQGAVTLASAPGANDALIVHLLESHAAGYDLGLFFFGVSCVLLGVIFLGARRAPSWLGAMLSAAGVVYLVGSAIHVAAPGLQEPFAPAYLVPVVAEVAFCAWLLAGGRQLEVSALEPRAAGSAPSAA